MAKNQRITSVSLPQHGPSVACVALYARVSTLNGQDPEMQLRELREYCERRGLPIAGEYVDRGVSGSRERRPALDQLLADCRRRRVDAVVCLLYTSDAADERSSVD